MPVSFILDFDPASTAPNQFGVGVVNEPLYIAVVDTGVEEAVVNEAPTETVTTIVATNPVVGIVDEREHPVAVIGTPLYAATVTIPSPPIAKVKENNGIYDEATRLAPVP